MHQIIQILNRAAELLYPFDLRCSLCSSERGMGTGCGICESCIESLEYGGMESLGDFEFIYALKYQNAAAELVKGLKYSGKRYFAPTLAYFLAQEITKHKIKADIICPVPLHKNRQRHRGFNQSALIAKDLSQRTGVCYMENALFRIRDTKPQENLNQAERVKNVAEAFVASTAVKGKVVLIVDDVLTTGSTMLQCGRKIIEAGGIPFGALCTRA